MQAASKWCHKFMQHPLQWLFKNFLKGLLVVVPLTVTLWVVYSVFKWIDGLLKISVPGLGFLITFVIIVTLGALGSNIAAKRIMSYLEGFLNRLPLVKLIYFSLKDLIGAFVGETKSFRVPVLVSLYPETGVKVLGFVTSENPGLPETEDHVAVVLPQSYNFAGFLIVVPRSRITPLPPHESARWMSFIVSGGVSRGPMSGSPSDKDFATDLSKP